MNSYAIVFAALIVVAAAGSISRSTGWSSPSVPQINVDLTALVGANGAGDATANQQLTESAVGDINIPALITSISGAYTGGQQNGEIAQVASVDVANAVAGTVLTSEVNQSLTGAEVVAAEISGGESANFANSGASNAAGEGDSVNEANSNSQVNQSL